MADHGYELTLKHYTRSGLKRIARGEDPEGYAYNAIFHPTIDAGPGRAEGPSSTRGL